METIDEQTDAEATPSAAGALLRDLAIEEDKLATIAHRAGAPTLYLSTTASSWAMAEAARACATATIGEAICWCRAAAREADCHKASTRDEWSRHDARGRAFRHAESRLAELAVKRADAAEAMHATLAEVLDAIGDAISDPAVRAHFSAEQVSEWAKAIAPRAEEEA